MKLKTRFPLFAGIALLSLAACNSESSTQTSAGTSKPVEAVQPPANGDWSTVATATTGGGYVMGNPNAKVQLIEIGALTCSHCREFEEAAVPTLVERYVKTGQVAWEFRPYLLNGLDIPANLVVGCNGAGSFFPLMKALYKDQNVWIGKMQSVPPAQMQQIQSLPPEQLYTELAKLMGLQDWAAMRGVSQEKSAQCLKDQQKVEQLVQVTSDIQAQFPDFAGTPSFIINGELKPGPKPGETAWGVLEPQIKEALGS